MTPLKLQQLLKNEVEQVLKDIQLADGGIVNVYEQSLPAKKGEKDTSFFPFCRISLVDGEDNEESTQDIVLVFGVIDNNKDFSGYQDVMNCIQRVREHLNKKPIVGNMFEIKKPIRWAAPEDEAKYPFFYGAMQLTFIIPSIEQVNLNT